MRTVEYVSLWRTQRIRFRSSSKSGFSSARRREATCAVRAFGLLEYSSLPTRSALCDEPRGTQRTRFRIPLKSRFSPARRPEAMRTGVREPLENAEHQVRIPLKRRFSRARRAESMCTGGVHETPRNAAREVPQLLKKRVLMRKARRADVYWSTLGPAERSASGSATP